MADADRTLKVLIELGIIGESDADRVRTKLAEMNREAKEGANQLEEATKDLGKAEEKGGESAEFLHHHHRALHEIMDQIGQATAPELGRALAAGLLGPLGIAIAVGEAFEALRDKVKAFNDDLDAMAEKAAEAFANVKTNLFDAIRDEVFSTEKVDKYFQKIEDDADQAKQKIEDALALLKVQQSAQEQKNAAGEAAALENIKFRAATDPSYSKPQQVLDEQAVKDHYAALAAAAKVQGENAGVDASQQELKLLEDRLNELLMQQHQRESTAAGSDQAKALDRSLAMLPDSSPTKQQWIQQRAAGTVDYAGSLPFWDEKNTTQSLAKYQKNLGIDDKSTVPEKDSDLDRLNKLKERLDPEINRLRQFQSMYEANANDPQYAKDKADVEIERKNAEKMARQADALQSQVDVAQTAVDNDRKLIEAMKDRLAVLKDQAEADKKLKEAIEELTLNVKKAQEALNLTKGEAAVRNDATTSTAQTEAQVRNQQTVETLLKGTSTDNIVAAGVQSADDLQAIRRSGYTPQREQAEYQRAVSDQNQGRESGADMQALERHAQVAADQTNIQVMNRLLEAIGGNQQRVLQLLEGHTQLHMHTSGDIQQLQQQVSNLISQMAGSHMNHQ